MTCVLLLCCSNVDNYKILRAVWNLSQNCYGQLCVLGISIVVAATHLQVPSSTDACDVNSHLCRYHFSIPGMYIYIYVYIYTKEYILIPAHACTKVNSQIQAQRLNYPSVRSHAQGRSSCVLRARCRATTRPRHRRR